MRFLFVLQNFPPSKFGGVGSSTFEVVHQLLKYSEHVKVLTTDYKIPQGEIVKNKWTKNSGIDIMFVNTRNSVFYLYFFLNGFRQIKKSDVTHLSSIFYFPTLIFAIYSRFIGRPFVVSPHGELHSAALSYKSWKKRPYLFILSRVLKKSHFRATSKDEYTMIKNYFPESKITIIPNCYTSNLPINERRINQFIFLGRISPIKNIENLIIACSQSKEFRKEKFKFLLCGPIDDSIRGYKERLEKLIEKFELAKNIIFTGEVNSPIKEKLISQSKALFLISHSENFGGVVLESLAQGTLVVASKGTPWQQLEILNCGFWIENTPKVIALTMDDVILMNKQTYGEMSGNALLLSKEFTPEKLIPLWIKLHLELKTYVQK
jgi:glycosyltransferase involved in cell wall biosynthesis